MATIYIPVEVPDDELNGLLAKITTAGYPQAAVPTQPAAAPGFVRTESQFGYQVQQAPQPADPWAATGAPSPAAPYQPAPTPTVAAAQPTRQGNPMCNHGEMRFVPAGVSQSTGRAYGAFFGCCADRSVPKAQQCKSIKVGQ